MSVIRKILDRLLRRRVEGDDRHPQEESFLNGTCPDCSSDELLVGPRGGMAVNVKCSQCGSIFNIVIHERRLLFVERIHYGVGARTEEEQANG